MSPLACDALLSDKLISSRSVTAVTVTQKLNRAELQAVDKSAVK